MVGGRLLASRHIQAKLRFPISGSPATSHRTSTTGQQQIAFPPNNLPFAHRSVGIKVMVDVSLKQCKDLCGRHPEDKIAQGLLTF